MNWLLFIGGLALAALGYSFFPLPSLFGYIFIGIGVIMVIGGLFSKQ